MIQDIPDVDRRAWNEWIWAQFTSKSTGLFILCVIELDDAASCAVDEPSGSGFRPSPFMTGQNAMDDIVVVTSHAAVHCEGGANDCSIS